MIESIRRSIAIGFVFLTTPAPKRTERGLSQSTENAILLAGAVTVAVAVVTAVGLFVNSRMPK